MVDVQQKTQYNNLEKVANFFWKLNCYCSCLVTVVNLPQKGLDVNWYNHCLFPPSQVSFFNYSLFGSCVFCAPLDRCIGRHIDRQSTDISVNILGNCRPICWSTYRSSVGRYVDGDVSLDTSANTSVKHRSICRLTLDQYVGQYVDQE